MMNRDMTVGKERQAKGKIREEVGWIVGDKSMENKGKIQQVAGKLQEDYGKAKRDIHEATKD
jgi:uncharacterized protein YjbJ (UPF0337 family)